MTSVPGLDWPQLFAQRAGRMTASEIRELLKLLDQPDVISFAGGIPDPHQFPRAAFAEAYGALLGDPASARIALQYSVSEGYRPLKSWIAGQMGRLGVPCTEENILITAGSQQGLDFLGRLLLSPNDTALVAAPTYLGALQAFSAYEPSYDALGLDRGNATPQAYRERAAAQGGAVKFAYLVPDFANPTGNTVPLAARHQLLDLAEVLDIGVIEDAAYQALRYDGDEVPPVLALDIARAGSIERSRTVYAGTFSKTLAPALRVGWLCAARPLIDKLVLIKQASDLHCATINQMVMHRVAETTYQDQITRVRQAYAARRDAMLAALARHMPPGVTWSRPQGGMFIWVTLPEGVDGARLLARAVAEARVAFVPGKAFFAGEPVTNTIRLSFSLAGEAQIDQGLARLGRLIAATVAGG